MLKYAAPLLLVALVAGCAGAGSSGCQAIAPPPPQMTYPQPGATGVADGNFTMTFAYTTNPAALWSVPLLSASGASSINGGAYTTILAPVDPGSSGSYGSQIPALQKATTYSVTMISPPSGGACMTTATLGSFTTQ